MKVLTLLAASILAVAILMSVGPQPKTPTVTVMTTPRPEPRLTMPEVAGTGRIGRCRYRRLDSAGDLGPDPRCTPGALNPAAVSDPQATICTPGYSRSIRPPEAVTEADKRQDKARYGQPFSAVGEEDHLVALEDGGAPSSRKNLWFEPGPVPNAKDEVENRLHDEICSGQITVEQAARILETNWTVAR